LTLQVTVLTGFSLKEEKEASAGALLGPAGAIVEQP
jgi:hypothetical protein